MSTAVIKDMNAAGSFGMSATDDKQFQRCPTCVETKTTKVACKRNLKEGSCVIIVHATICGTMLHGTSRGL